MKQAEKIILFDGVCNLCNSFVDIIPEKARKKHFRMVPLQSDEGQNILNRFELQHRMDTVIFIQNNKVFSESDAVLEICKHLKAPWRWLTAFKVLPKRIRNLLYRWVANKRYKWFGQRTTCRSF